MHPLAESLAGRCGVYGSAADIAFDDSKVYDNTTMAPLARRTWGSIRAWFTGDELEVGPDHHDGNALIEGFYDDDYMVEVEMKRLDTTSRAGAVLFVRAQDYNNTHFIKLGPQGVTVGKVVDGHSSTISMGAAATTVDTWYPVRVKVEGTSFKVWVKTGVDWPASPQVNATSTLTTDGIGTEVGQRGPGDEKRVP